MQNLKNLEQLYSLFVNRFDVNSPDVILQAAVDNFIYSLTPPVYRSNLKGLNMSYIVLEPSVLESMVVEQRGAVETFLTNNEHIKGLNSYDKLNEAYQAMTFMLNKLDAGEDPNNLIYQFMELKKKSDGLMTILKPIALGLSEGSLVYDRQEVVHTYEIIRHSYNDNGIFVPQLKLGTYQGINQDDAIMTMISEKNHVEQNKYSFINGVAWFFEGRPIEARKI